MISFMLQSLPPREATANTGLIGRDASDGLVAFFFFPPGDGNVALHFGGAAFFELDAKEAGFESASTSAVSYMTSSS